jgi:site-specific recombinase XerD
MDPIDWLLDAAMALDHSTCLIVLLGGEAGLRCGEMMALEWRDVDLTKRQICVQRSEWKGNGSPISADAVKHHVERAARRARLDTDGVHRLRHTFCSHLAMRGAPARAIQELAAHQD